jgi:BON domain
MFSGTPFWVPRLDTFNPRSTEVSRMFGRATNERVAGKATLDAARGAGKAARGAGKVLKGGAKSPAARRAARWAGRVAFKGGRRAVRSSGETFGARWLRYGFFALFGFALGALLARWGKWRDALSGEWRDARLEQELEQRIRTRVGEDPRTSDVPRLDVEVDDGVAEIRGEVHSDDEKSAVEEIATGVEGVTEVRNLLAVNPDAPSRRGTAGG